MPQVNFGFEVSESHLQLWERKDWRYAILMGGRGNGRSGSASRHSVSRLVSREYTRGALMRALHSDIRSSSWLEIIDRLDEHGASDAFRIKDGEMHIEYGQNSLRAFGFKAPSGSNTARLKSLANYNYVWIEEAEEIGEDEFTKLDDSLRTVKGSIQVLLSLNTPPKDHWIIKRWFDLDPYPDEKGFYIPRLKADSTDVLFIGGTYHDNLPNIDPHTASRYEKYRETNPAYYYQFIKGLCPETVLGRIYTGWKEIDEVPHEARLLGRGLDFGYDPDPAAALDVYWYNGGIILDEILYQTELTNPQLAASLRARPERAAPIVADSAEPKSIAELQAEGLNVIPCDKGSDSVDFGIKHVQGIKISYTKRSKNLKHEYENYAWLIDKKTGENRGIEDPKKPNHLMSAARYALRMFVGKNSMYDPEQDLRQAVSVRDREREVAKRATTRFGL